MNRGLQLFFLILLIPFYWGIELGCGGMGGGGTSGPNSNGPDTLQVLAPPGGRGDIAAQPPTQPTQLGQGKDNPSCIFLHVKSLDNSGVDRSIDRVGDSYECWTDNLDDPSAPLFALTRPQISHKDSIAEAWSGPESTDKCGRYKICFLSMTRPCHDHFDVKVTYDQTPSSATDPVQAIHAETSASFQCPQGLFVQGTIEWPPPSSKTKMIKTHEDENTRKTIPFSGAVDPLPFNLSAPYVAPVP